MDLGRGGACSLINAMGGLIGDAVIVGENKSELDALMILSTAGGSHGGRRAESGAD